MFSSLQRRYYKRSCSGGQVAPPHSCLGGCGLAIGCAVAGASPASPPTGPQLLLLLLASSVLNQCFLRETLSRSGLCTLRRASATCGDVVCRDGPLVESPDPPLSSFAGNCGSLEVRAGVANRWRASSEGRVPAAASSSRLAPPHGASKNCRLSSAILHALDWALCCEDDDVVVLQVSRVQLRASTLRAADLRGGGTGATGSAASSDALEGAPGLSRPPLLLLPLLASGC